MNLARSLLIGILVLMIGGCFAVAQTTSAEKSNASLQDEVERYVEHYFENQPDFSPAYLITREQTEPLLEAFRRRGWSSKMIDSLAKRLVSKEDFLARELDSPAGRKFMKQIAQYPHAYDRLDRLSRLPLGRQTVHDLIYKVGGGDMIEYLTTSAGGKEMGKMLSQDPHGQDFNKPTGRIYTLPMLVAAFREEISKARRDKR
ncbi:MAG: hypothetical protein JXB10_02695 [Pirellulales bacterium]|nr:hypothetical protein [Pirellulales bacterium]